ncbi:MAG: tRNA dimethylallyltransferase, partial [Bacteroidota bacterium]|nr:tRNA dimethylallyltransferase [Bacteroidota bacterium]
VVDRNNPIRLLRAIEVSLITGIPYSVLRTNKPAKRSFSTVKLGLTLPREELNERIDRRTDEMMKKGFLEEARQLFPFRKLNALNTVGYKELFDVLDNKCTLEQALVKIKTNTRRYAKRQMTWFKRDPEYQWFHPNDLNGMISYIDLKIKQ